jgi:hypothetical protein
MGSSGYTKDERNDKMETHKKERDPNNACLIFILVGMIFGYAWYHAAVHTYAILLRKWQLIGPMT